MPRYCIPFLNKLQKCLKHLDLELLIPTYVQVSFCCKKTSMLVLEELMRQYNSVSSSELRNLSHILVEIMVS
jgi:hypothetical protein